MRTYLVKRLVFMVATLLVITMVSYTMMRVAPGDPIRGPGLLGGEAHGVMRTDRRESLSQQLLREKYHLDRPPIVGYLHWLWGVVRYGDFGSSIVVDPGTPVVKIIAERLPPTLKLNVVAILLVYASAVPIGIYASVRSRKLDERIVTVLLFILYSMPTFWVALLLMMFLASPQFLPLFPVSGLAPDAEATWGKTTWQILAMTARHYVLPVFCLTYGGLAGLSRYTRVGMLEVIRQDYIRTARAKGLSWGRVILVHAFRNALLPLITLFAGLLPGLVAGSVVIEYIFSIPGMGSMALNALNARDYPLMMALFSMGAFLTLVGILLSDLCYALADPRITFE